MGWFSARWSEPESRAGVAAALAAAAGYFGGQVSAQTAVLALFGALAAFVLPGPGAGA